MPTNEESQAPPTLAMRLIFEYQGDQVRLVSQHPVDVAITGFDISHVDHPGYYVDTQDSGGRTLARVPARDAFHRSQEIFPEQPGQPITRLEVDRAPGAFTVVVPVPTGADRVSVVRIAPATTEAPLPGTRGTSPIEGGPRVTEVASFPLNISR